MVLEDLTGSIEVTVFPRVYDQVAAHLAPDTIVAVEGVVESGEDRGRMRAQNVVAPHMSAEGNVGPLALTLPAVRCTPGVVNRLKEILAQYPGAAEASEPAHGRPGQDVPAGRRLPRRFSPSALFADLKAVLGPSCVGLGAPRGGRSSCTWEAPRCSQPSAGCCGRT